MRVLVTGGAGLIGSHLCDALLAKGHEVVSIDNLSYGSLDNHHAAREYDAFHFLRADIRDHELPFKYKDGADCVVHLAAFKIPRYGNRIDTLTVNGEGSRAVFDMACNFEAKLVFASTSDIYGRNESRPLREEDAAVFAGPEVARWAYAVSKFYEEHMGFAYAEKFGIPVVGMRFFASFGPRSHRSWWGGPAPVFIEKVCKGEPITIHGDGSQTRCFSYVSDIVDGIVRCVEDENANNEVFNIGNPREISILDFAKLIHHEIHPDKEPQFSFVPYETFGKYEDVKCRVPDISKIKRLLGYEPKVSVEEAVKKTVEWQRKFYDR